MRSIVATAKPSHPYRGRLFAYGFRPHAGVWIREELHALENAKTFEGFCQELTRAGCAVYRTSA